jgi:hypothetical protein
MLDVEVMHEARWAVLAIARGLLDEEEARELISVNAAQASHLRRTLGAPAELVIENRLMILERFEELLTRERKNE